MKRTQFSRLLLLLFLGFLCAYTAVNAQSAIPRQALDYFELKGMLLKHKATVESILSMKRFNLSSSKERPESMIYAYKKESDTTQILVRIRNSDGLVSEIAWNEGASTLGNLKHDAVYDGFVPVAGNSRYYNRFQKMSLFVNYTLAQDKVVPCMIRAIELEF